MKKDLLLLLLVLCTSVANAYDFEVDGIYYNITSVSQMTVEVTAERLPEPGYDSHHVCRYEGDIEIPQTVSWNEDTYNVTKIGDYAFATDNNSNLSNYMFGLKSIKMPETIQTIGKFAFLHCKALSIVKIPASVTFIDDAALETFSAIFILVVPSVLG